MLCGRGSGASLISVDCAAESVAHYTTDDDDGGGKGAQQRSYVRVFDRCVECFIPYEQNDVVLVRVCGYGYS